MRFFLLALALAFSNPPQEQESDRDSHVATSDQRGSPGFPFAIQFDSAQNRSEAEQRDKDRQEKAASDTAIIRYTKILAFVGALQLLVFGYQALKLKDTVGRMREAEKLTAESVTVLRAQEGRLAETIAQMQRSEERQLRAYLFVVNASVKPPGLDVGHLPSLVLAIKNAGQTPAYSVRSEAHTGIHAIAALPTLPLSQETSGSTSHIGPGAVIHLALPGRPMTPEEISQIAAKTHLAYMYGMIRYLDAFGKKRTTNFRNVYADGEFVASNEGNEAN